MSLNESQFLPNPEEKSNRLKRGSLRTEEERTAHRRQKAKEWREKNKDKTREYKAASKARKQAEIQTLRLLAAEHNPEAIEELAKYEKKKRDKLDAAAAAERQRRCALSYYERNREEVLARRRQKYAETHKDLPKKPRGPKPKKIGLEYLTKNAMIEIKLDEPFEKASRTNILPGGALRSPDDENDIIFEEIATRLGQL